MEYQHSVKDSPLNSACVVENLCCYFKQIISCEKTKLKNIYATRWLIFAGPVTYTNNLFIRIMTYHFCTSPFTSLSPYFHVN